MYIANQTSHTPITAQFVTTVKPDYKDHLYDKIYYLWCIQYYVLMKTEGTNLLLHMAT